MEENACVGECFIAGEFCLYIDCSICAAPRVVTLRAGTLNRLNVDKRYLFIPIGTKPERVALIGG